MLTLAIGVFAVLLLTLVPLRVDFMLGVPQGLEDHLTFTWGGFFRYHMGASLLQKRRHHAKRKFVPHRAPKNTSRKLPRGLYSRSTLAYTLTCMRRLLRQTRVGPMHVWLKFGCDNPADTGLVFAGLVPLRLLLGGRGASVNVEPCFWQECLELRGQGRLTFVPLRYLAVLVSIATSPRTWQLVLRLARESKS